jgi:hypothetical protein
MLFIYLFIFHFFLFINLNLNLLQKVSSHLVEQQTFNFAYQVLPKAHP